MKNKFINWLNYALAAAIAMLGFGSCNKDKTDKGEDWIDTLEEMYGCPYTEFSAEGYVLDEEGLGLEGICIVMEELSNERRIDTLRTDSTGKYSQEREDVGFGYEPFNIIAIDPNNVYPSDTAKGVKPTKIAEGDGSWYEGEYKVTQNFTLRKK